MTAKRVPRIGDSVCMTELNYAGQRGLLMWQNKTVTQTRTQWHILWGIQLPEKPLIGFSRGEFKIIRQDGE